MGFVCTHNGHCCCNKAAPVNLTVGDLIRMSDYLKKPVTALFPTLWHMTCFTNPVMKHVMAIEPGLTLPCPHYKNKRCSIYPNRPLNCRIFPYWMMVAMTTQDFAGSKDNPDLCCAAGYAPKEKELQRMKTYVSEMGGLIMFESQMTERIQKELGLNKNIELPVRQTMNIWHDLQKQHSGHALERARVITHLELGMKKINQKEFIALGAYIEAHRSELRSQIISYEKIQETEQLIRKEK